MNRMVLGLVVIVAVAVGGWFWPSGGNGGPPAAEGQKIAFGNNSYDALSGVARAVAGSSENTSVALPGGKLGAGDFVDIVFAAPGGGCTYDLKITKESGEAFDRMAVSLCDTTFYHCEDN